MCQLCIERIIFHFIKQETIQRRPCKVSDIAPFHAEYAQETKYLSKLVKEINYLSKLAEDFPGKRAIKDRMDDTIHVCFIRSLEDIILEKKIDYFCFGKQMLLSYAEKKRAEFEKFQKEISWLKFWNFLFKKEAFMDLQWLNCVLREILRKDELREPIVQPLNYYLDRFTPKPETCKLMDRSEEILEKYRDYYWSSMEELLFLSPIFHCCLAYLAKYKKDNDILWEIATNPNVEYGLIAEADLWLKRRAIFYLIDTQGVEIIPELIRKGCLVRYIYFYSIKNRAKRAMINSIIRKELPNDIVDRWDEWVRNGCMMTL